VKGITGESFIHESLILPQGIPALCDDSGLRTPILATLPTLDERGVVVRHTGGRDPHRGIQISGAPAGGPQHVGVAPSAPTVAPSVPDVAPAPWTRAKGCKQFLCPRWHRGSEEERQRQLRHGDGSFVSDPPEASEDCWWSRGGRPPGPGHAEARQSSATTTIGSAATATTTTIGPATATTTRG
jgi:hypothetical protein